MCLLEAMATEEGIRNPKSRPARNNNPGDINWGTFAQAHGADHIEVIPEGYTSTPRFAHFPTIKAGYAAMKALLQTAHYRGQTVRAMLLRYAPPADNNDVSTYEATVCKLTGCKSEDVIDPLVEASQSFIDSL